MTKSLVLVVLSLIIMLHDSVNAKPKVPAIFIFGDSTADVGTNSFLPESVARADFPPNGIDFPNKIATGRFSDGLVTVDFLAKLMGFKRSPLPFLALLNKTSALKKSKFRGLNFASGGSGLLEETGQKMITTMKFGKCFQESIPFDTDAPINNNQNVVPLSEQIEQFSSVHSNLMAIKGPKATKKFLLESFFYISIGSNDIFSYFQMKSTIPKQEFIASLGLNYEKHLETLIKLGAKKFGIISIAPLGCCPSQRIYNATGGCVEELNNDARALHSTIDALMSKLSSKYKKMTYSLGNAYEMSINITNNPLSFNFTEMHTACCGAGKFNAESLCDSKANLCSNRHEYFYWDLFHPTQAVSKLVAHILYGGEPRFVAPINFAQLAKA